MLETSFDTRRLVLRPVLPKDAEDILEILGDWDTALSGGLCPLLDIEAAKRYIDERIPFGDKLVLERKEDSKVVGLVEVFPEDFDNLETGGYCLGYSLNKDFRKRGYMREAVTRTKEELFLKGVPKVYINCFPWNTESKKVALGCGMKYESFREAGFFTEYLTIEDLYIFSQQNPYHMAG